MLLLGNNLDSSPAEAWNRKLLRYSTAPDGGDVARIEARQGTKRYIPCGAQWYRRRTGDAHTGRLGQGTLAAATRRIPTRAICLRLPKAWNRRADATRRCSSGPRSDSWGAAWPRVTTPRASAFRDSQYRRSFRRLPPCAEDSFPARLRSGLCDLGTCSTKVSFRKFSRSRCDGARMTALSRNRRLPGIGTKLERLSHQTHRWRLRLVDQAGFSGSI